MSEFFSGFSFIFPHSLLLRFSIFMLFGRKVLRKKDTLFYVHISVTICNVNMEMLCLEIPTNGLHNKYVYRIRKNVHNSDSKLTKSNNQSLIHYSF